MTHFDISNPVKNVFRLCTTSDIFLFTGREGVGPSNKSTQYGGIFFQIVDLTRAVDVLKLNRGKVVYVGVSEKLIIQNKDCKRKMK